MPDEVFQKYPFIEIISDLYEYKYKVKYTECVKEKGSIRFERKQKTVPTKLIEKFISEILESDDQGNG